MSTRSLILVPDRSTLERVEELVRALPWAPARNLTFDVTGDEPGRDVAAFRERLGPIPIGVLATDEPSVVSALSSGADEAIVLGLLDAASFAGFVDRMLVRARIRGEGQQREEAFAHAEKLASLGTLLAGVAHEINNPLTAMHLTIDVARRYVLPAWEATWELARAARAGEAPPAEALARLARLGSLQERGASSLFDEIAGAAESIAAIVRDLRVFARADQEESPELASVPEIVDQAVRLAGRDLSRQGVLERDYAADLPKVFLPRNRITQVIINVLVNAAHAIREVHRQDHRVRISVRADDEFVAVGVSDTGPGVPPELIHRIFDPFFTTKRQELGTGLGLSISRGILRRLGGELTVESVYGDGATFLCFLPVATAAEMAAERAPRVVGSARSRASAGSVLIVDDDPRLVRSYERLLNPTHRVLIGRDGRDAIELLESGATPDVVLLELDLPEIDGRGVIGWIAEHRPELRERVLVVTAVGARPEFEPFLRAHRGAVLHKPVKGDALIAAIDELIRGGSSGDTRDGERQG